MHTAGGFFITPVQVYCLPDKKTLPRLEGFSFELKLNKLTKKNNYNGTNLGVLLLMVRKSKT